MTDHEYTVTIDLLRHGEPEGEQCLRGSTNHTLTKLGWKQSEQATIPNPGWTQVVSSPLARCADFAKVYAKKSRLPLSLNTGFQEIDFGLWDGKTYKELYDSCPDALSNFWSDPYHHTPPEGELMEHFNRRVYQAWNQLVVSAKGEHVLLVTHGGVIRQILARILDIPERSAASIRRIHLPYASRCRIEVYVDSEGVQWPRLML